MNIILSPWLFRTRYIEIYPGVQLGLAFDSLSFVMGNLAVFQDVLKCGDFSISLSVIIFDSEAI